MNNKVITYYKSDHLITLLGSYTLFKASRMNHDQLLLFTTFECILSWLICLTANVCCFFKNTHVWHDCSWLTEWWAWHTRWAGTFKADCLSCHTWWMTASLETNTSWFRRNEYYTDFIYNGPFSHKIQSKIGKKFWFKSGAIRSKNKWTRVQRQSLVLDNFQYSVPQTKNIVRLNT